MEYGDAYLERDEFGYALTVQRVATAAGMAPTLQPLQLVPSEAEQVFITMMAQPPPVCDSGARLNELFNAHEAEHRAQLRLDEASKRSYTLPYCRRRETIANRNRVQASQRLNATQVACHDAATLNDRVHRYEEFVECLHETGGAFDEQYKAHEARLWKQNRQSKVAVRNEALAELQNAQILQDNLMATREQDLEFVSVIYFHDNPQHQDMMEVDADILVNWSRANPHPPQPAPQVAQGGVRSAGPRRTYPFRQTAYRREFQARRYNFRETPLRRARRSREGDEHGAGPSRTVRRRLN